MHVISASRRTDIPAFHADWFMSRVRAGAALVRRPFRGGFDEVSLRPEDVISIVFWTKNAGPLLNHLDELASRGHCFSFLYTVNNYPDSLEPGAPPLTHTIKVIEFLTKRFPGGIIRWRYDTIVITDRTSRSWHLANFECLCEILAPYTDECVFSFCDYYKKTVRNMVARGIDYHAPDERETRSIATEMAHIAGDRGIALASCAHDHLVSGPVLKARCIDPDRLERVVDTPERRDALRLLKKAPTRKDCGCYQSKDVGAYDTCAHGCVYCYANSDPDRARENLSRLSVDRPSLDPHAALMNEQEPNRKPKG